MPASGSTEDPKRLAQVIFAEPDDLLDVIDIGLRYGSDTLQMIRTLVDILRPQRPDGRICELGFGTGWLLKVMAQVFPDASLYGLDISTGMVFHARRELDDRVALAVGDMEALPFRNACLDVVVSCWTLYFTRDIDAALRGIRRILPSGGRFVAAVSAPDHMVEYWESSASAVRNALGRDPEPDIGARFNLESGLDYMRRHFDRITVREWRDWLVFPDTEPLIRIWDRWRSAALAPREGDLVRAEFVRLAGEWLGRDGQIRIRRHGAALVGETGEGTIVAAGL